MPLLSSATMPPKASTSVLKETSAYVRGGPFICSHGSCVIVSSLRPPTVQAGFSSTRIERNGTSKKYYSRVLRSKTATQFTATTHFLCLRAKHAGRMEDARNYSTYCTFGVDVLRYSLRTECCIRTVCTDCTMKDS